jgi:hypothetical protein
MLCHAKMLHAVMINLIFVLFIYIGYHWDCSDWNQTQNPLPNITEVPGSEVPDSSSFHSNESNESNTHHGVHLATHPGKIKSLIKEFVFYIMMSSYAIVIIQEWKRINYKLS